MSYESLDDYSDARTFDDFHDAKIEVHLAFKDNDLFKAAIAVGGMVAQFELLWQYKNILAKKLKQKPPS